VPLLGTSLTSAEMIKYAANAFLTMKIGFANEIANICERVGAEATEVMAGIGLDSRIGAKFLNARRRLGRQLLRQGRQRAAAHRARVRL
jgi:UDPglucose 6-dehydrogenase